MTDLAHSIIDMDLEMNLLSLAIRVPAAAAQVAVGLTARDFATPGGQWLFNEVLKIVLAGDVPNCYALLLTAREPFQRAAIEDATSRFVCSDCAKLIALIKSRTAGRDLGVACREWHGRLQAGADGLTLAAEVVQEATAIAAPAAASTVLDSPTWKDRAVARADEFLKGDRPAYLDLGLPRLSKNLVIQPGSLSILAGMTGKGKTSFALAIAWHIGEIQKIPCLYLNSEMTNEELGIRLLAIGGGITHSGLRTGASSDIVGRARELAKVRDGRLYISDALDDADPATLAALAACHQLQHGTQVVILDYIQRLAKWDTAGRLAEWQSLQIAVRTLKSLATTRGLAIILLAQLNQAGELAGASGLKREADLLVELLEVKDAPETAKVAPQQTHWLRVLKARHVPSGKEWPLVMDASTLRFTEIEPVLLGEPAGGQGRG